MGLRFTVLNLISLAILYAIEDSVSGFFVRWQQRPTCSGGHDHIPVTNDCHAFYHCWGFQLTLKHCGPLLMFNPVTKVCDWPSLVMNVRPQCNPNKKKKRKTQNKKKTAELTKPIVIRSSTTTSTTTIATTTTAPSTSTITTTTRRRRPTTKPSIFFIKPITLKKKKNKNFEMKDRDTKSLIGYNGLFDLNSLKVFTKSNITSLSSSESGDKLFRRRP